MEAIQKKIIKEKAVLDKRYWLKISNVCNKCIFCLDSDFKEKNAFIPFKVLKEKILQATSEGYTRLVVSGGESTISPQFIETIQFAKQSGFKKIQVITNGRMFSYKSFATNAINAGLTEVTFSIHGHNSKIHDKLTGVNGSFNQALKGIKNLINTKKCIINIDIVINKLNLKYLYNIIDFFSKFGIYEYDLLRLVPFGRAYKNRKDLLCDENEFQYHIKKILKNYKEKKFFLWTNRIPPSLLEDNEEFIQDPHKLYDEILGRKDTFKTYYNKNKMWCYSKDRCNTCFIKNFCELFIKYNDFINNKLNNYKILIKKSINNNLIQKLKMNTTAEMNFYNIQEINKIAKKTSHLIFFFTNDSQITESILSNPTYMDIHFLF